MLDNNNQNKLLSDEELILKFREEKNNNFLSELFSRYIHLTFHLCYKYLENDDASKDAVIEIFIEIMNDINKYEITHFRSWLYVKTKNFCLHKKGIQENDKIKLTFFEQIENIFMEFPFFITHSNKEANIINNEQLELALNKLNPEQKSCIDLFYFKHKTYIEIAEVTGFDLKQVKSHLQNGKRNLKKIIISIIEA